MVDEKAHEDFQEDILETDDTPEAAEFRRKEAALVRKLDIFIAPVMMMLMLISYLDRGNIGFAATQGMTEDIHLKGTELNVSALLAHSSRMLSDALLDRCFGFLHLLYSCRSMFARHISQTTPLRVIANSWT